LSKSKGQIDYVLALVVLFLVLFGVVMIASIGVPKSIELTNRTGIDLPICGQAGIDCYYLLKKHLGRILIGLVAFLVFVRVPLTFWRKMALPAFAVTLFILVYVLVAGTANSTFATAWLTIQGTSLQPAEFAKIGLIIYLARWLENKGKDLQDFHKGFISFCVITGIVIIPLVLQPDFGSALVFTLISVGMFYLAGAQVKHLLVGVLAALVLLTGAVSAKDYLRHRLFSYLNPSEANCMISDSGVARDYCWQTEQANIAVASGGLFGQGLTKGVQKSYWLPQASDDFIFAASAEELGFFRSILIVFAFAFIGYRGLVIAKNAPDRFSMYLATGITLWISGQAFINIGVNTGVLPVTGLTLPFISYGGSSILATFMGTGILLNISRYSNFTYAPSINRRRDSRTYNAQHSPYRNAKEEPSDD
jgi:cell division protein FtsW